MFILFSMTGRNFSNIDVDIPREVVDKHQRREHAVSTMSTPLKCLVVAPNGSGVTLLQQIVVPVAKSLGLHPSLIDEDSNVLSMLKNDTNFVLIDCHGNWTYEAGYALGLTHALEIPYLVLIPEFEKLPQNLVIHNKLKLSVDYDDNESVINAVHELKAAISPLIRSAFMPPRPSSTPISAESSVDLFDINKAERLMFEFFLEGMSVKIIEQELTRLGAPPSWVRERLRRRPGW